MQGTGRVQVSSSAMQALQTSGVLDSAAAVQDGGALVFDDTKAIWQYEGNTLLRLLQDRMQVRPVVAQLLRLLRTCRRFS